MNHATEELSRRKHDKLFKYPKEGYENYKCNDVNNVEDKWLGLRQIGIH